MQTGTVLVTGYNGFTGRCAAAELRARGFRVVGLVQGSTASVDEYSCDITSKEDLTRCARKIMPDYVLHLAGLAFVGHSNDMEFYNVNLFGTMNLLEALGGLKKAPTKILVSSSANIYGVPVGIDVVSESVVPSPVNHYATSKLAMECMARTWFDRLPLVLARPFNYTGPGQDERFLIPKIVNHFRRHEKVIELGNLDVSRDFSDVRDVVRAYADLLVSDAVSDVFNVCSGRGYALRDVIAWASSMAGYEIEVRVNPAFVRPNEIPRLVGDGSKLTAKTGYQPRYTLRDSIEEMLELPVPHEHLQKTPPPKA